MNSRVGKPESLYGSSNMLRLSRVQAVELAAMLSSAFSRNDITMLLQRINEAAGDYIRSIDNDKSAMLQIVNGANAKLWWRNLLQEALTSNPSHEGLKKLATSLLSSGARFHLDDDVANDLREALATRYPKEIDIDPVVASIDQNWSHCVVADSIYYSQQLPTFIQSAAQMGWITTFVKKVIEESKGTPDAELFLQILGRIKPIDQIAPGGGEIGPAIILLGSAKSAAGPSLSAFIDTCVDLFQKSKISVLCLKDRWIEQSEDWAKVRDPGTNEILIAIHCVDETTASAYAYSDGLPGKYLAQATRRDVSNIRQIAWLPDGLSDSDFAEKIASKNNTFDAGIYFQTGSPHKLCEVVKSRLHGEGEETELTPAFGYERIEFTPPTKAGSNIIREVILPRITIPLRDKFKPPEWEAVAFSGQEDARTLISGLRNYPFGILAINNFSLDPDLKGEIPLDFQGKILSYESIIQEFISSNSLNGDNILRVGIILTTNPAKHLFKYLKGTMNEKIARWYFVAVGLAKDGEAKVADQHLKFLCDELDLRLRGRFAEQLH